MKRYITRPARAKVRQCDEETYHDPSSVHHVEVFEREPRFTGLLNADGDELWWLPAPIGFCRDDD
jgi:hypothetical protein